MYQVLLTNLPTNAIVGKMFIQSYFFPCCLNLDNDFITYLDCVPSAETIKHIHLLLLRGKNILIYKFGFKYGNPTIVKSYLRMKC
jgi:hypothetical protein